VKNFRGYLKSRFFLHPELPPLLLAKAGLILLFKEEKGGIIRINNIFEIF